MIDIVLNQNLAVTNGTEAPVTLPAAIVHAGGGIAEGSRGVTSTMTVDETVSE